MNIGAIIKEYRKKNHVTMGEFAERCNLSKGYISMLEKNQNPITHRPIVPSIDTMRQVAGAMEMDINELVRLTDDSIETTKKPEEVIMSLDEKQHLTAYRQLNQEGRIKADAYVNDLLQNGSYVLKNTEYIADHVDEIDSALDELKSVSRAVAFGGDSTSVSISEKQKKLIKQLLD